MKEETLFEFRYGDSNLNSKLLGREYYTEDDLKGWSDE